MVACCIYKSDDIVIKSPNDRRLYRVIELDNGLCALLVHDPEILSGHDSETLRNSIQQEEAEEEECDDDDDDDEEDDSEEEENEEEEDEEQDDEEEEREEEGDQQDNEGKVKGTGKGISQTKKVSVLYWL